MKSFSVRRTITATALVAASFASPIATASSANASPLPTAASATVHPDGPNGSWAALEAKAIRNGRVPVVVVLDAPALAPTKGKVASAARAAAFAARDARVKARDLALKGFGSKKLRGLVALPGAPILSFQADRADLAKLRSAPGVLSVFENKSYSVAATTYFGAELPAWWHFNRIGLDWTSANGYDGRGNSVVIIDTGVDKAHPWLSGRVMTEACFAVNTDGTGACAGGAKYSYNNTSTGVPGAAQPCATYCAHGTHVAHIAAGKYGVAPGAKIVAIRASHLEWNATNRNWAPKFNWSDIINALWYVYDPLPFAPASVNLSIGGGAANNTTCDNASTEVHSIATYVTALKRDYRIATVISSGNDNYANGVSTPACVSAAVVVGNSTLTAANGVDAVYGNTQYGSNSGNLVDLLAPGTNIWSAMPGNAYGFMTGTSMAAPQVAGAFAVMRQSRPTATVDQILSALQRRGTAVTDSRNNLTRTRINIANAVYYW